MGKLTDEQIDELIEDFKAGKTRRAIAESLGITHQSVDYWLRRKGFIPLHKRRRGKHHHSWKGGTFIDSRGYRMVRVPERTSSSMYCAEHVLRIENLIGRPLKPNEVIHHVNGIKTDNDLKNLHLCTRSEHRKLHAQLEEIAFELFRKGAIVFETGGYRLVKPT